MRNIIKKDGFSFAFDPNACNQCNGACCRGESGYIWLNKKEVRDISGFLGIEEDTFLQDYCKNIGKKITIKETRSKNEYFCIFFEEERGCKIYPVRPEQCRSYPFWPRYKNKKNINEVCKECIGILLFS